MTVTVVCEGRGWRRRCEGTFTGGPDRLDGLIMSNRINDLDKEMTIPQSRVTAQTDVMQGYLQLVIWIQFRPPVCGAKICRPWMLRCAVLLQTQAETPACLELSEGELVYAGLFPLRPAINFKSSSLLCQTCATN